MTDLDDEVREILASPPGYAPRALDFDKIMADGTKVRRRRSIATGAASFAAVLILIVGGAQLAGGNGQQHTTPPATVSVQPSPSATVATPAPKIDDNGNGLIGPLGEIVDTGEKSTDGNAMVIYGTAWPNEKDVYQFSIGEKLPSGDVNEWYSVMQDQIPNATPGFHATQKPTEGDGGFTPAFGFYVGSPAEITATHNGKPITARLATWSYKPGVTIFWFSKKDAPGDTLANLKAYDASGNALPAGNTKVEGPA